MNKNKKHPKDMTTDELAQHIFPKKLLEKLKEIVQEKDRKPKPKSSSQG
jgi:hypothetical protein